MVRSVDMFGEPIRLNYQGKGKYTTTIGGIISISVLTLLVYIFVLLCSRFYTGFNPVIAEFSARFEPGEHGEFDPFSFGL
jgi:hypothetical protein